MNNITKNGATLYIDNEHCCGCGGCSHICPKGAITMQIGEFGAIYPDINIDKCIGCNLCVNFCTFGKNKNTQMLKSYAATNINIDQKMLSSSAGIFPALATYFLQNGDGVVGVAMNIVEGKAQVNHILITQENQLSALQGSKYVQSDGLSSYNEIKNFLNTGKRLLLSGTPCQIASFKSLFKNYYNQIFCVDIICHGVPSLTFFNEYLLYSQQRNQCEITQFIFRDKKYNWGLQGGAIYKSVKGDGQFSISPQNSSYYRFFIAGETYRDSCYSCPYACLQRTGDLTIGDYWGANKFSPELMKENGGEFDTKEGVSCVLCNNLKGQQMLEIIKSNLVLKEVDIDKILIINKQLREPAKHTGLREKLIKLYNKNGYKAVEKVHLRICRKEKTKKIIKSLVPKSAKKLIKKVLK